MTVPQTLSALDDVGNSFFLSLFYICLFTWRVGRPECTQGTQRTPFFSGASSLPLCRAQGLNSGCWAAAGTSYLLSILGARCWCFEEHWSDVSAGTPLSELVSQPPWLDEDLRYGDRGRGGNVYQYLFVCLLVSLSRGEVLLLHWQDFNHELRRLPCPSLLSTWNYRHVSPTVAVHSAWTLS